VTRRRVPTLCAAHPLPPAPQPSAVSPAADGPAALLAEIASLRERVESLERERLAGGANRKIPLAEIAARLNHAPSTLRAWAKDPKKTSLWRLDILLVPSPLPSREVYSTPRLLAQWEDHVRDQWTRVLYGTGLRSGERLVGIGGR
jgi:hypothetical protein